MFNHEESMVGPVQRRPLCGRNAHYVNCAYATHVCGSIQNFLNDGILGRGFQGFDPTTLDHGQTTFEPGAPVKIQFVRVALSALVRAPVDDQVGGIGMLVLSMRTCTRS
jgi:hypothetical protein